MFLSIGSSGARLPASDEHRRPHVPLLASMTDGGRAAHGGRDPATPTSRPSLIRRPRRATATTSSPPTASVPRPRPRGPACRPPPPGIGTAITSGGSRPIQQLSTLRAHQGGRSTSSWFHHVQGVCRWSVAPRLDSLTLISSQRRQSGMVYHGVDAIEHPPCPAASCRSFTPCFA